MCRRAALQVGMSSVRTPLLGVNERGPSAVSSPATRRLLQLANSADNDEQIEARVSRQHFLAKTAPGCYTACKQWALRRGIVHRPRLIDVHLRRHAILLETPLASRSPFRKLHAPAGAQ